MGIKFQQKPGAGAPEVEDGPTNAIFVGVTEESHPDWAGEGKFGHDDGERWRFLFQLVDDEGDVLYNDERDPVELDKLTSQTVGKKSTAYSIFKGLLTKGELELLENGEEIDGESVEGRPCQLVIAHNDNKWPVIESVVAPTKAFAALMAAKRKGK